MPGDVWHDETRNVILGQEHSHDNRPSQEAIQRLRDYVPPPTAYEDVPLTRRAAVLLLLYADAQGELRVVITIRAKTLSSCTYPEPKASYHVRVMQLHNWRPDSVAVGPPCSQGPGELMHDMRVMLIEGEF